MVKCYKCFHKIELWLENYICKCGNKFCSKHYNPNIKNLDDKESHICFFDYKEEGKKKIIINNPKIVSNKIIKL